MVKTVKKKVVKKSSKTTIKRKSPISKSKSRKTIAKRRATAAGKLCRCKAVKK